VSCLISFGDLLFIHTHNRFAALFPGLPR